MYNWLRHFEVVPCLETLTRQFPWFWFPFWRGSVRGGFLYVDSDVCIVWCLTKRRVRILNKLNNWKHSHLAFGIIKSTNKRRHVSVSVLFVSWVGLGIRIVNMYKNFKRLTCENVYALCSCGNRFKWNFEKCITTEQFRSKNIEKS